MPIKLQKIQNSVFLDNIYVCIYNIFCIKFIFGGIHNEKN